jgi:hypothetical protein
LGLAISISLNKPIPEHNFGVFRMWYDKENKKSTYR